MPRSARSDVLGVVQHVMARGIEGRAVFRDDRARLGTRQSGLPEFQIGNIPRDGPLLQEARDLAQAALQGDPGLTDTRYPVLREALQDRWQGRLERAQSG